MIERSGPVVVVGVGEMGGAFARGLLRTGHTVIPVLRDTDLDGAVAAAPHPALTLVTVGESDLDSALGALPPEWRPSTGLLQNELLPRDWKRHSIEEPTVAVVWFEKKPGSVESVILPTPVAGPARSILIEALTAIGIPAVAADTGDELTFELVRKNLYILTGNIAGLEVGGTMGELWERHAPLANRVAQEILDIQEWLVGAPLDRPGLIEGMVEAIEADPAHKTTGRSAPHRLARAMAHAAEAGLVVPTLDEIARDMSTTG